MCSLGRRGDTPSMQTSNLFSAETDIPPDGTEPPGYLAHATRLGPKLGASLLGMSIYDLPPGEAICPYHFEWTDEEWLIVLAGRPTLRTPDGERVLEPWDTAVFVRGPAGAHQVRNVTETPVRVVLFSSVSDPEVVVYPDEGRTGVLANWSRPDLPRIRGWVDVQ
jgi:uncharacterized cupin superfamily protein